MDARATQLFDDGNEAFNAGRWDAAEHAYGDCLAILPGHVDAAFSRGNALARGGRLVEAVEAYLACLQIAPDFAAAYSAVSEVLRAMGVLDHAKIMAEAAVAAAPRDLDTLICLAGRHFDLGEFQDAARLYGEALAIDPTHARVLNSLANTLRCMGELDEALAMHERCYTLEPENAAYRYDRAMTMLAAGDYRRGWAEHEWRKRRAPSGEHPGRLWRGEALAGRRILLQGERGLGDTLQFVRYASMVADRGAFVVLEVQPGLARLLRSVRGVAIVATRGGRLPATDLHCPLMSLPWLFGTTLETVPADVPYLAPPPETLATWRERVEPEPRLRVGLVWAGGPHPNDIDGNIMDRRRSMPVEALAPFVGLENVQFYSLQKDHGTLPHGLDLVDLMPRVIDFADTAALIAQLDLVITVDTSVAHLAGAMGKKVWMLSRFDACWRWMRGRDDSPWYPDMKIYRQQTSGDWAGVIAQVVADLRNLSRQPRCEPPSIPPCLIRRSSDLAAIRPLADIAVSLARTMSMRLEPAAVEQSPMGRNPPGHHAALPAHQPLAQAH